MIMTFPEMLGDTKYADVLFHCPDGVVLPAHRLLCRRASVKLADYIDEQNTHEDVSVPFDGQTLWRVLSFVYKSSYSDDEKDLSGFDNAPASFASSLTLMDGNPVQDYMDSITDGFFTLSLSSAFTKITTFSKAWIHAQVYIAATTFGLDRLAIDSAQRFVEEVKGNGAEKGFVELVGRVYAAATRPALMDPVVAECLANIHFLYNQSDAFSDLLQRNNGLAALILRTYANQANTPLLIENGESADLVTTSSNAKHILALSTLEAQLTNSANKVTELEGQLLDSTERVTELESDVTESTKETSELKNQLFNSTDKITKLEGRIVQSNERMADLEGRLTKSSNRVVELKDQLDNQTINNGKHVPDMPSVMAKLEDTIAVLEDKLDVKDEMVSDLKKTKGQLTQELEKKKSECSDMNARMQQMTQHVNAQRAAQAQNSTVLFQLKESEKASAKKDEQIGFLQKQITSLQSQASQPNSKVDTDTKNPALVNRLRDAEQDLKNKDTRITFLEDKIKTMSSAPKHKVESFGLLGNQIKAINGVNGTTPSAPHRPTPTAPPHVQGENYFQRAERLANAGINGAATNGHAINGAATNGHATNGHVGHAPGQVPLGMQLTSRAGNQAAVNGTLLAGLNGPHNGQSVVERQAKEIRDLQKTLEFTKNRLSEIRMAPITRSSPVSAAVDKRYKNLIAALKDAALDHKHCGEPDCHINFNCQFLDIVDNRGQHIVILKCTVCEAEKHRWNLDRP